jgi:hypothetical protein
MSRRLSSESCSEYENPSAARPCRFESGSGQTHHNVSSVEARELARILGTNLACLELAVEALERANDQATGGKSRRRSIHEADSPGVANHRNC